VSDECIPWLGTILDSGYGMVWYEGKYRRAHRVIYETLVGPIPPGKQLDHLCRNKRCVNVNHLEPVTGQENIRRARGDYCKKCGEPYKPRGTAGRRRCIACQRAYDSARYAVQTR